MGNNQNSSLRSQFDHLELRESTKKQLWQVYFCTLKKGSGTQGANSEVSGQNDEGSESPPSSPTVRNVPQSASSKAGQSPIKLEVGEFENQQPITLVMLQLNTLHPSFRAAAVPPKVLNPDHHIPSQYKLRYNMLETSLKGLEWLRDHPHRSLLRIKQVECHAENNLLAATTPYVSLEPVLIRIPLMSATEILYGLVKIAEALAHLHSSGLVHRNVSWKSVYLAYMTPSSTTTRAEASWVLGEPQFISGNLGLSLEGGGLGFSPDAIRDYLSEIRGARQDPSILSYFAPEVNNPYAASQLDWQKVPIGSGDVYSFGVMIDMVLNTERTRFPGTSSVFYNAVQAADAVTAKDAIDELRAFAKSCQIEDPLRRPDIENFFDLNVVRATTYVQIQHSITSREAASFKRCSSFSFCTQN